MAQYLARILQTSQNHDTPETFLATACLLPANLVPHNHTQYIIDRRNYLHVTTQLALLKKSISKFSLI